MADAKKESRWPFAGGQGSGLSKLRDAVDDLVKKGANLSAVSPWLGAFGRAPDAPASRINRASLPRKPAVDDLRALRGAQPLERPTPSVYRDPRDELLRANTPAGADGGPPLTGRGDFLQWPAPGRYGLNPSDRSVGQGDGRFGVGHRGLGKDGRPRPHHGIDISLPEGEPVYAGANGRVLWSRQDGDYGQQVLLDHGDGTSSRYAHLSGVDTKVGERIARGQAIGRSGRSGNVPKNGQAHLHFEVRRNNVPEDPYIHLGPSAYPDRPQGDQLLRIWRD